MRKDIRRFKETTHITTSFPCNDGGYGHIHKDLKDYIGQDLSWPTKSIENANIGLIRMGISKKEDPFLTTLSVLLKCKNIKRFS